MDLTMWADQFRQKLKKPLPGSAAHNVMRATTVGSVIPRFDHRNPPKPGGVLILLYPDEGEIKFPLTLRADYLGAHSGQVSLPGGKTEAGESPIQTALRECEEEIGVRRESVTVLGTLTEFNVIASNFLVVPVVGICDRKPSFVADPVEVVKILEFSLSSLLSENAIQEKEITVARQFRMNAPHFLVEGQVVWGATAMMLNEFRTIAQGITPN